MAGIVASFSEKWPTAEITAMSADPEATAEEHDIKSISRMNGSDVMSAIKNSDLVISGGGSLLQDVTSTRSLIYYLSVMWLAKVLSKKLMIYAQGVGPINCRFSRKIAARVIRGADAITVRDADSKDYLAEMGIDPAGVFVTADPSFVVKPAEPQEADSVLAASGVEIGMPLICVAVRRWKNELVWLPNLVKGLNMAASSIGAGVVFVPMQRDNDLGISIQIASELSSPAWVVKEKLSPRLAVALIGRMSLVLGMRLHSLMFASAVGVPFVAISYDPKVSAFSKSVGAGKPLALESLTADFLADRLVSTWKNRATISASLCAAALEMKKAALSNVDIARALVEGREPAEVQISQ